MTGWRKSGVNATYRYDGHNLPTEKTVNNVTTRFLWDGSDLLTELDGQNQPHWSYLLGAGREGYRSVPGNEWFWYLTDAQGSVLAVTDAAGEVRQRVEYPDPYGEPRVLANTLPSHVDNRFFFTGEMHDAESGLVHLHNRYYDARHGRFVSRDPIRHQGGLNLYSYCENDPVNSSDPSGLQTLPDNRQLFRKAIRQTFNWGNLGALAQETLRAWGILTPSHTLANHVVESVTESSTEGGNAAGLPPLTPQGASTRVVSGLSQNGLRRLTKEDLGEAGKGLAKYTGGSIQMVGGQASIEFGYIKGKADVRKILFRLENIAEQSGATGVTINFRGVNPGAAGFSKAFAARHGWTVELDAAGQPVIGTLRKVFVK